MIIEDGSTRMLPLHNVDNTIIALKPYRLGIGVVALDESDRTARGRPLLRSSRELCSYVEIGQGYPPLLVSGG